MDAILELARDLASELQNDERFVRTQLAQSAADEDTALQDLIGEFNLQRIALSNEMAKEVEQQDKDKITKLDTEIREIYARLMANGNMKTYQEAKGELDKLVNSIVTIVTMAAQGQNPDEIEESGCSGNCSGCSGCH